MCKLVYSRDSLIGLRPYASKTSLTELRKLGICNTATHRSKKLTSPTPNNISLKFGLMNAQSVIKKQLLVYDHIVKHDLDLLAITETWAPSNSQSCLSELLPDGYEVTHQARLSGRGGGVALVHRKGITCKLTKASKAFRSFQMMEVMLTIASSSLRVAVVYRPPKVKNIQNLKATFFEEFEAYLQEQTTSSGKLLIAGDFNFYWELRNHPDSRSLRAILESYSLQQHVTCETHERGHTLDLIMTRSGDNLIKYTKRSTLFSDHHVMHCTLNLKKPPLPKRTVEYRCLKHIDLSVFRDDLQNSTLITSPALDLEDLLTQYDTTLRQLMDKHAPLKTKTVTIRPVTPWYNNEIDKEKKKRRHLEKVWRKSKLTVHRESFKMQRNRVNELMQQSKEKHLNEVIANCENQKDLFQIMNELLVRKVAPKLPSHDSVTELCSLFREFFSSKIKNARKPLDQHTPIADTPTTTEEIILQQSLNTFTPLTSQDIVKFVKAAPPKSCKLDPVPTSILKRIIDMAQPLARIINTSLRTGFVPSSLKQALNCCSARSIRSQIWTLTT